MSGKLKLRGLIIPIILVLVGVISLGYPVLATQWNNHKQTAVAAKYAELESQVSREALNRELEEAYTYNEVNGAGAIADPWTAVEPTNTSAYQEYRKQLDYYGTQLDQYDAMARIVIPKIQVDLPIYHGTSEETLQRGVGHLFGTDLPVGGVGRHSVLTAHTGLSNATLFDNLTELAVGDAIYVQSVGEKMKYQVHDIDVVLPNEVDSIRRQEDKDLITLITCTPYGVNTHRLLVHAERVPLDPADDAVFEPQGSRVQWWMWLLGFGALFGVVFLVFWIVWWRKKRRQQTEENQVDN